MQMDRPGMIVAVIVMVSAAVVGIVTAVVLLLPSTALAWTPRGGTSRAYRTRTSDRTTHLPSRTPT